MKSHLKIEIGAKAHHIGGIFRSFMFLVLIFSGTPLSAENPAGVPPTAQSQVLPHRAQEIEVKVFLRKLNAIDKGKKLELAEFSLKDASVYKKSYLNRDNHKFEESGNEYHSLWIADINNDGKPDYVWTDEVEGSGHFDNLEIYNDGAKGWIVPVTMPGFKCDYSNVDRNLFSVERGKTYFHLVTFIAEDKKGKILSSGTNANAANAAYYLVMREYKCLWSQGHVKVVERKESKEKYE
jgi:hypothetical protein